MRHTSFLDLVRQRQSTRGYLTRPVERGVIERCLEAARMAPSACNAQPWTFIVVDKPELKNRLADFTANRLLPLNHWTKQAPVHVVAVVEKPNITSRLGTVIKNRDFAWMDVAIAAEHFCLQAAAEGLGTCMLGWFNESKVKGLLQIPPSKRVGLLITIGYPADDAIRPKMRKGLSNIVSWNRYRFD